MSSKNVKLYLCGVNFLNFLIFFYSEQYLVRGAQFSEADLNGALMKSKNNTKNYNRLKKKKEQLSKEKVLEAQFGLDLKCLFRPNQNNLI